jgi:acetylornithine/LysW-gamma-L-lysine aminotransferase
MARGFVGELQNESIIALEQQYEVGVYPKRSVAVVRGAGAKVWDADGREFIDCVAGHGSANLGHCHTAVVTALQEQAPYLLSCPEIFHNDQRATYLAELAGALPFAARVFLCNSGAEAIEGSLKFARLLTGKPRIIAMKRGFHGRTMGALSATWEPKYREPFQPLLPEFTHVAYNNVAALEEVLDEQTAAVLLEVVQGEGGVNPAEAGYLAEVRRLCDAYGALMVVDEVQTGFGRTGRMLAIEHEAIEPDIVALAKSIAAGLPMGAVVLHARHGALSPGKHGTTFGGNPLMCAVARTVLRVMQEEDLPQQAAEKGEWLMGRLREIGSRRVREVRGRGLLVGIDLRERVQPYLTKLMDEGVLALPAGPTVLRLLPPLVIGYDELEVVAEKVAKVLD